MPRNPGVSQPPLLQYCRAEARCRLKCFLVQDSAFIHDFELFANNLDNSSFNHTNITSWAW